MTWWIKWSNKWTSRVDRTAPTPRQAVVWLAAGAASFAVAQATGTAWLAPALAAGVGALSAVDWVRLRRWGVPSFQRDRLAQVQRGVPVDICVRGVWPGPPRGAAWRQRWAEAAVWPGTPESFKPAGGPRRRDDGGGTVWLFPVVPSRRGPARFDDVDVAWHSPFGWWRRLRRYGGDADAAVVHVLPDLTSWRREVFDLRLAAAAAGRHAQRMASGGTEFSHITDYCPDDDPRHLNWAAVARRGRLMKNVYEPERGQVVWIAVDASRHTNVRLPDGRLRLDLAVDCAAALADTALAMGDAVGFVAFTSRVIRRLPPRRGPGQFAELLQALAGLEPEPVQGGYASLLQGVAGATAGSRRRGLLVVLSELDGVATDALYLPTLRRMQQRYPTVLVSLADVEALRILRAVPADEREVLRAAAAEWVMRDRERLKRALWANGVAVVESLPGEMVVRVVREYLQRRGRFTL
ncbi:MAG: DUF58 domain-containing protein [Alicyclobacillaceae bacterium]|nr:DUF58 domain-containing protein [Alicyclobacillaceae bacterium]